MESLFISTGLVALAEIGDKTQLLALVLAARYRRPWPIIWGIAVATLVNHALAAVVGSWVAEALSATLLSALLAVAFAAVAVWALIPDRLDEEEAERGRRFGPFLATLVAFFLAEMGDKTQVATVVLAAQYADGVMVILGTTLGMLLANVPVVLAGNFAADRLPLALIRRLTAAAFAGLALYATFDALVRGGVIAG